MEEVTEEMMDRAELGLLPQGCGSHGGRGQTRVGAHRRPLVTLGRTDRGGEGRAR